MNVVNMIGFCHCEGSNETFGSIKGGKFVDQVCDYRTLKEEFASLWS
jgi:hypothetical protein